MELLLMMINGDDAYLRAMGNGICSDMCILVSLIPFISWFSFVKKGYLRKRLCWWWRRDTCTNTLATTILQQNIPGWQPTFSPLLASRKRNLSVWNVKVKEIVKRGKIVLYVQSCIFYIQVLPYTHRSSQQNYKRPGHDLFRVDVAVIVIIINYNVHYTTLKIKSYSVPFILLFIYINRYTVWYC